jgi:hypothetical protein
MELPPTRMNGSEEKGNFFMQNLKRCVQGKERMRQLFGKE